MDCYQAYKPYVTHLENLVSFASQNGGDTPAIHQAISSALDGQVEAELHSRIPIKTLRQDGVFFTGSELTQFAFSHTRDKGIHDPVYLDPACGSGNLLIACADQWPVSETLEDTLEIWGRKLIGRDIFPEFIQVTRARIALTAIKKGALTVSTEELSLEDLLPNIQAGDGLAEEAIHQNASNIVMNPPFVAVKAPEQCSWASGNINYSALFLEHSVLKANKGTRITAILPEVLRSGSRYGKWRQLISSKLEIHSIVPHGRFNKHTDIDIFILDGTVLNDNEGKEFDQWWMTDATPCKTTVGQIFSVNVGSVVPYRDAEEGEIFPYIHSGNMPAWEHVNSINESRRFKGRTFKAPFVVIRRTSSPKDRYRAVGTVVTGDKPIAVENHLLVLKPLNGGLKICKQLVLLLQTSSTNYWLNERIRCRHLTVSAIKEIPWDIESP